MTKVIPLFPNGAPTPRAAEPDTKKTRKPKGHRKGNLIQVTKSFGRKPDGKRDTKVFYGKTYKEACAKRDRYVAERQSGLSLDGADMTLTEWIEKWYSLYKTNLKDGNLQNYKIDTKRLENTLINNMALGTYKMRDIREAHLHKALFEMEGKSTSAILKYRMTIQQLFKRAKKNKIIGDNPADDLDIPDGTKGTHRALLRWEADCILQNHTAHRCGLWAMIGMLAGLRPGEIYALRWEDVDLNGRTINVHSASQRSGNQMSDNARTKTAAGMRVLPICDPLHEAFARIPEDQRTGYVALSERGARLTVSAARKGWSALSRTLTRIIQGEPPEQAAKHRTRPKKPRTDAEKESLESKAAELAKLPRMDFRPHDLRHTFATALFDAGVDVKSAQYYLGHADIQMTLNLYTHLSEEREKDSRATLVKFLDKWIKGGADSANDPTKTEQK